MDATVLGQYGLAGLVIAAEATAILYLNRKNEALQGKIDQIQDQRLAEARETRDKLVTPLEDVGKTSEKTYELLQLLLTKRGR